jgi:hypothetical protein
LGFVVQRSRRTPRAQEFLDRINTMNRIQKMDLNAKTAKTQSRCEADHGS